MQYVLATLAFLAGLGVTLGLWYRKAKRGLSLACRQAAEVRARTTQEARALFDASEARLVERREQWQSRAAADLANRLRELEEYESDLNEREQLQDSRERVSLEAASHLDAAVQAALEIERSIGEVDKQAADTRARHLAALEQKCGSSCAELREQLVRDWVSKVELASLMRLRESEDALTEAAPVESRSIMQVAIERYDGASHLERMHNTVPIEQREMFNQLADAVGNCHTVFVEEIGCELVCDEETRSVTVRGEDPIARELARRVLRQLAGQRGGDPERIRHAARLARSEIEREVQNAGRRACRALELGRVHPDIVNLIGRLKYRLSYSQNQLRHSIEVGHLAGIMAEELGLDPAAARRGGLLHDIGKAMTHDHDGSHAVLGAEVARRCREDEVIANAIGSHHNDEPPRTAIAQIVTAADAISGARPGARRESVTQYLTRISEIQRIASRSPAVRRVDIMQAGREVRVVVAGDERGAIAEEERHRGPMLADADIQPLAREIAAGIEKELTFAGQIKVTVIRESRAVSVAH
jgi:ribonucrease Y